ncbi:MAG: low-specificity L-threonine aldolase [Chloroflexi bacterium]|nr:low-specificity L-threonine aldolase [Chloroflexota bacterium]
MKTIDLRSDTVTLPPPEMREAIAEAELGDDVFRGDPTVNRLEEMAAELMGKEAALLTTSGTQSNLTAMLSHCQRGAEVILGDESHIVHYEVGGASALGGLGLRTVSNDEHGRLDLAQVRHTIRSRDVHFPSTSLICVENTHNRCGGGVLTPEETHAVAQVAHAQGIPVHLDGARIWNASVASGIPARELCAPFDSVAFCLSKGLSCPIGSVVVGPKAFIQEADRWRKMLGAGMRQVGIVAAAGLVALDTMIDRMQEDHDHARHMASRMAEMHGISVDPERIQTNIVRFGVPAHKGDEIAARLKEEGVHINGGDSDLRVVTHYGVSVEDYDFALVALDRVMKAIA